MYLVDGWTVDRKTFLFDWCLAIGDMSHWRNTDFEMHQLPFGAMMTDKLFRIAQAQSAPGLGGKECVRSIVWAPQSFAVPGKAGWVLQIIRKDRAEPDRIFNIDGLPLYISVEVEPLVSEQIFDWDDTRGVVSRSA